MNESAVNLSVLRQGTFNRAKRWLTISNVTRIFIIVLSLVAHNLGELVVVPITVFSLLLTIVAVVTKWLSEQTKGLANSMLNSLDMYDGLNWKPSRQEISDWLALTPEPLCDRVRRTPSPKSYFDSDEEPSYRRLLQNIQESSWYSKHIAHRAAIIISVLSISAFIVGIIILVISIYTINRQDVKETLAQVVISMLMLLFSGGYIFLAVDYEQFSKKADRVEAKAAALIKHDDPDTQDVIKLVNGYQIARTASPILPDWLWNHMEKGLNAAWQDSKHKIN